MYGPDVAILLMYGSHNMRHTSFPQVDGGQWDSREMERHSLVSKPRFINTLDV